MKKIYTLFLALLSAVALSWAGEPVWHDASEFPLYGKISEQTNFRYERLPAYLEGVARKPVWNLGRNSAGLYLRFSSDSPFISVKWEPLFDNTMGHMADTGTKGVDLYMLADSQSDLPVFPRFSCASGYDSHDFLHAFFSMEVAFCGTCCA